MSELSNDKRCRRNDGRGWRCKMPVAEGKGYCERHITQGILRQKRQPVPDHLKFERARRSITLKEEPQEQEQGSNEGEITDLPLTRTRAVGNKRVRKEEEASDDVVIVGDAPISKEVAKEPKVLNMFRAFDPDIFGCGSSSVPESPVQRLPSIKRNVKATAKKKINKCHWCRLSSYRVLVKCSTCQKQFFCQDCIDRRFHCKNTIMRECPVCLGECTCQACTKGKPKNVKTKEPFIHDVDEDVVICDPEKEMNVCNREKEFDKSQRLHIIRELLPVIEKMNQEMMMELDTEAKHRGKSHDQIKVQFTKDPQKKECSFCKACITVVHRICDHCAYNFCLSCCEEYRSRYLHTRLENLKTTRCVRSKKSINIYWNLGCDGSITCPPKNLGGCGEGVLNLTSFSPFGFTKHLEEAAKHIIVRDYKFIKTAYSSSTSSPCPLCDENDTVGLKFSTKKEFMDMNLEHFRSHWRKAQPLISNVVFKPVLNWDIGFILCEYLKRGAKSREGGILKGACDWFEVNFGKKQIISRGTTSKNVWKEFVKFKLTLSGGFLQDNFPSYYDVVMNSLPIQEYMNPLTGSHNLAANLRDEDKKSNLGFYVNVSYGGLEDPMDADLVSNLCLRAHDVVNVLVNATAHPFPHIVLNDVKILMNEYNLQDNLKSSKKIVNRNIVEEMAASSEVLVSDEYGDEESDDEDLSHSISNCGAKWDIYRREDVPKLVEYLTKYSDVLTSTCYGSPKKVVHPLFDEIFYLSDFEKMRLKEEYDVEAWSFEQHIGESVIIPAGCPYQMKKTKSSVNVIVEFISPESVSECIKVSNEIRLLPVNHLAKGNVVQVKNMVINLMQATIDEVNT